MADLETQFRSFQTALSAHRPRTGLGGRQDTPGDAEAATTARSATGEVPIVLVTGFLGAGKSTLLAACLSNPPDSMRIRAVVNDVGALGFDPSLVAADSGVEVELTSGCGCCVGGDDLAQTLARIVDLEPDLIVVEASGITDPVAMAQVVAATPGAVHAHTVAVLDATTVASVLNLDGMGDTALVPIARRQCESAEVIVLTNVDRLPPAGATLDSPAADAPLPSAELLAAVAEEFPGRVIHLSGLDEPATEALLPGAVLGAAIPTGLGTPNHDLPSRIWRPTGSLSAGLLVATLESAAPRLLRAKGWVETDTGPLRVQIAGGRLSVEPLGHPPTTAANQQSLLLTARDQATLDEFGADFSRM